MREITVALDERSYRILIGPDLIRRAVQWIKPVLRGRDLFIAVDENVAHPHGKALEEALVAEGLRVVTHVLPAGEESKSVAQLDALWDALSAARFGRQCAVIAVGGGVIGDLAGFAAASYLRGVDFIQVPTSLLAMVDSSVGGKTGINNRHGKNLLGAFWQPRLVLADTATLKTLPEPERVAALAEVIKYGVIFDKEFFAWLEANIDAVRNLDPEPLAHAIGRSCEIKADVVSRDERESGLRQILNFGHTVGHAIENSAGYGALRHGEAIAVGMAVESSLGLGRSAQWTDREHERLVNLLHAAGLPTRLPPSLSLTLDSVLLAAQTDKKNRDGEIRYIIPVSLGEVRVASFSNADVTGHLVSAGVLS